MLVELNTVVITGGSGFVGSSIAVRLERDLEGASIYAFDSLMRRGSELNLTRLEKAGVEFMHGDIRCSEDLGRLPDFDPETSPMDLRIYLSDCAAVSRDTTWKPLRGIREIVTDTLHWIEMNESTLRPIFSSTV